MKVNLLLLCCILEASLFAQDSVLVKQKFKYKNSVQVELFGSCILYSVQYERILINRKNYKAGILLGASYYGEKKFVSSFWGPAYINQSISLNPKTSLEFGIGHVFTEPITYYSWPAWNPSKNFGFFSARLGFRFQHPLKHFVSKLGFSPLIDYEITPILNSSGNITQKKNLWLKDFYPTVYYVFGWCF